MQIYLNIIIFEMFSCIFVSVLKGTETGESERARETRGVSLGSPWPALSTKCSSEWKLHSSGYLSWMMLAMKCSRVCLRSVDFVSSSCVEEEETMTLQHDANKPPLQRRPRVQVPQEGMTTRGSSLNKFGSQFSQSVNLLCAIAFIYQKAHSIGFSACSYIPVIQ